MSRTVVIGWGACAPMRPKHVLTQLAPYGVNVENLAIDMDAQGSTAYVTVSDEAARWTEYLLLRSGKFGLFSPPIDARNVKWAAKWHTLPAQKGCGNHTQAGTVGAMPERKRTRPARRRTNARQRQQDGGLLGTIAKWFR